LHALETSISCTQKDIEKWNREAYELSCRETKFQEVCNKSRNTDSQMERRVVLDLRKEVKKLTRERGVEVSKKLDKEKAVYYLLQKIDQLKMRQVFTRNNLNKKICT
jgi:citrate lyase alpha subunit